MKGTRIGARPNLAVLRADVRAIEAYLVPSAVGFIKLDAMENPFGLPEAVQKELGERLAKQPLNRYPISDPRGFKERLGKAMGLPLGARCEDSPSHWPGRDPDATKYRQACLPYGHIRLLRR